MFVPAEAADTTAMESDAIDYSLFSHKELAAKVSELQNQNEELKTRFPKKIAAERLAFLDGNPFQHCALQVLQGQCEDIP